MPICRLTTISRPRAASPGFSVSAAGIPWSTTAWGAVCAQAVVAITQSPSTSGKIIAVILSNAKDRPACSLVCTVRRTAHSARSFAVAQDDKQAKFVSPYAFKLWLLSGKSRMRFPVAAKIALSTAGAATAMVGSPTPPQNPPDGTITVSTLGMSASLSVG